MITSIQFLRSIGQFDFVSAGAITLDRYVLVYSENGRGKTTLTAILRSLSTGDPLPVRERRRLGALNPPHAVLHCSTGQTPAVFVDGAWNRTFPNILIFDDRFVDENVCSGLSVEPAHRQNLHEVVIGSRGVTLNRRLQELVLQIEEHNANLRIRAAAIPEAIRGAFSIDEFCELPAIEAIDEQIQVAERTLAAAQQQDAVRETPGFDMLVVPTFDIAALTTTLELALPYLDEEAVARLKEHFAHIGLRGEAWVAEGMWRIPRADAGNDVCPFCTQDLTPSRIIGYYREYFSEAYVLLRERIGDALVEVNLLNHPRELPGRFERSVRAAAERRQFWSGFCDVPEIALESEQLMSEWEAARDAVIALLEAKRAAPLDRMEMPQGVRVAIESLDAGRRAVETLNERLQHANDAIQVVKERAAAGNSEVAAATLARLIANRTRHAAEVSAHCEEYLREKAAKAATERLRDETRQQLGQYRTAEFPRYQAAINMYLGRFNAGFRISSVAPADTRGGPACNYEISINNFPIPISGAVPGLGEPAFKSVLSSGDRSTLALAFFFAALERDPNLADKVVVIDDPASSLDENRSLTTVQELRRLAQRASQTIVLSHNKSLLCRVWLGIDRTRCSTIKLERVGDGSDVLAWDVSNDSVTEHDLNHALLRSYLQNGPRQNSREVAKAVRPVLEEFLRVAYPEHFPPGPGAMGRFIRLCWERLGTPAEILSPSDTQQLDDLVEYASQFHHTPDNRREDVAPNDGELRGFVDRAIKFATRARLIIPNGAA
jgi:wobble nucleotide-excising tRNase